MLLGERDGGEAVADGRGRASGVCGKAVGYAIPCEPEVLMRALFWFYIAVILAGLATAIVIGALGR